MKLLFLAITLIIPCALLPQAVSPVFSVRCDEQYTRDMHDILTQFSGFTNEATLKVYKDYMILVKLHADLGFTLRPVENAFTSAQRARLRTPLQHYVTCRSTFLTSFGLSLFNPPPTKIVFTPCEQTYAIELQAALSYYASTVDPTTLAHYQDYMVLLKRYQDVSFSLKDFEKRTPFDVFSKLRTPRQRYDLCKDTLIRTLSPTVASSLRTPSP